MFAVGARPLVVALLVGGCTAHNAASVDVPVTSYGGTCTSRGGLPDPVCTPGDADPRVTPDNIHATICRRGYTKSVRPPKAVSHRLKIAVAKAYGIAQVPFATIELDHLIPLSLGGSSDTRNLWPQFRSGPANVDDKDRIAMALNRKVCSGQLGLRQAQRAMASDWRTAG